MLLTIQQRPFNEGLSGVQVLSLAEHLTLGDAANTLRQAIHQPLASRNQILVDLAGVSYIDSAGLGES